MTAVTAQDVIEALQRHHRPDKGWVTVPEVAVGTGGWTQRIDLFAMGTWRSTGYERIAYEVKISRSDFLHEVKNPSKRAAAVALSHRFVFATPAGMVTRREVPEGCGLVHIQSDGRVFKVARGDRNPEPDAPETWIASLLRTAAEQRSMGWRCAVHSCHARGVSQLRAAGSLLSFCAAHGDAAVEVDVAIHERRLRGVA